MIISASRRTDLPAYYSRWFFERLRDGYALVRNPVNPRQVSYVSLSPSVVDGFVFWTKNPGPMLPYLDQLPDLPYYFQITLTPYKADIETNLPSKREKILPAIYQLARRIGPDRIVWRYDPIFLTRDYSVSFHKKAFAQLARALKGQTFRCMISFLDWYAPMEKRMAPLSPQPVEAAARTELAASFSGAAQENGMEIFTCAEAADLSPYGIEHGCCIDGALLEQIGGQPLSIKKDPSQRPACGCAQSIDIGAYDSCPAGCLYCYGDHGAGRLQKNLAAYDPASPLLCSRLHPDDMVRERKMASCKSAQVSLFEQSRIQTGKKGGVT